MQHSFDVDIAKEYGILEAILLNNIWFWIEKNKANNTNYYDGFYWTYNSTRAFNELFPYVSQRQIQNALKKLIDDGVLQTGNYNKVAYDRTLWYAFTKKGKCIMQKCKMDDAEMLNGSVDNVQPIPDIKQDITTDGKPNNNLPTSPEPHILTKEELIEVLENEFKIIWAKYPNKQGKASALKSYIKARTKDKVEYDVIENGLKRYLVYCKQNKKWYSPKNGSTWFNQQSWNDEYPLKELTTKDLQDKIDLSDF